MAKINFVRTYKLFNMECYDVLYATNRLCSGYCNKMPSTVKSFIATHKPTKQYDKTMKYEEIIYK